MKALIPIVLFILIIASFSGCIDEDKVNETVREAEKELGINQDRETKYNSQHHYANGTLISVSLIRNWIGKIRNMKVGLKMNKTSKFSDSSYYDKEIINTFLFNNNEKYYNQLLTLVSQNISIYFYEKGFLKGGSNHNIKEIKVLDSES